MLESSLYIAYHDGTKWIPLTSTVDTETKTVTAYLYHFSTYALMGKAGFDKERNEIEEYKKL
jgi:hypothetical protein